MQRPIFVISDLHLGDGGHRDNFSTRGREQELERFLDYVVDQEGELLILGDLFEFWQMNLSKIIVKRRSLLDRLHEMGAVYVLGNHDADLSAFVGTDVLSPAFFRHMSGPIERVVGGKRFRFMHGHEVDGVNSDDAPTYGRAFCILAGIFEDGNGSPMVVNSDKCLEDELEESALSLREWAKSLFTRLRDGCLRCACKMLGRPEMYISVGNLTPAQNPSLARELLAAYKAEAAKGYDVLIVGHTHQAGRIGSWYFNSGTWARTVNSFVKIEPSGETNVFNWIDGRAEPNGNVFAC